MRLRLAEIELFNEHLLLSERTVADVRALSGVVASLGGDRNNLESIIYCLNVVQDALKINFEGLKWYQFYRKTKLKILFSTKVLLHYLSAEKIVQLHNQIVEDLEAIDTSKADEKGGGMSETYQYVMVANISNIPLSEVDNLPITTFREILELSFSWGNYLRGEDFAFISSVEKRFKLILEHQKLFPEEWRN